MGRFALKTVSGDTPPIDMGEVDLGFEDSVSDPIMFTLTNTDSRDLRDVTVSTDGPGSRFVQLARDDGVKPGVWAAAGESILVVAEVVSSGASINFWARISPNGFVTAGDKEFDFVVNSVAIRT